MAVHMASLLGTLPTLLVTINVRLLLESLAALIVEPRKVVRSGNSTNVRDKALAVFVAVSTAGPVPGRFHNRASNVFVRWCYDESMPELSKVWQTCLGSNHASFAEEHWRIRSR